MSAKMRSRPPASVDDFVAGPQAESVSASTPATEGRGRPRTSALPAGTGYPWEAPGLRDDVLKAFNLRLPEPYVLKLRYISEHTPDSMQRFCLDLILPAIDQKIQELTKK